MMTTLAALVGPLPTAMEMGAIWLGVVELRRERPHGGGLTISRLRTAASVAIDEE